MFGKEANMGEVYEMQREDMRCMANLGCNKTHRKRNT
jgi:hypothetical protein